MPARIGIELAVGLPNRRARCATRPILFSPPVVGPRRFEAFRSLGRRRASVIVWDAPNDQRRVVVTDGSYEIATRLAGNLAEFVSAARLDSGGVSLISVCGPLPDLRSMAALLVDRLDIEVESLDTLFGIDPSRVPTGTDHLRDRIAELRLAWAAAGFCTPRHRRRPHRRRRRRNQGCSGGRDHPERRPAPGRRSGPAPAPDRGPALIHVPCEPFPPPLV